MTLFKIIPFRVPAVLLLLCGTASTATACFWITGTRYDGTSQRASGLGAAPRLRSALTLNKMKEGERMQSALTNATTFNERSDYAVSLAFVGRTKEAVDLLQALEKENPGNYIVAANLGTALELLGNNEESLRWIREGIRRNPDSHDGTEWLHAKILESKIAAQKDPDYFKLHSVLQLTPENVAEGLTVDGRKLSSEEVAKAISYQLQERMQFVKPPDPAVASLLYDYGAIEAATNILESASGLLKMAVEYGYPTERVSAQLKLYEQKIASRKLWQKVTYTLVAAFVLGGLVFLYKARILVLSSRVLPKRTA